MELNHIEERREARVEKNKVEAPPFLHCGKIGACLQPTDGSSTTEGHRALHYA